VFTARRRVREEGVASKNQASAPGRTALLENLKPYSAEPLLPSFARKSRRPIFISRLAPTQLDPSAFEAAEPALKFRRVQL
jgi:hypothetical protein